MDRHTWQRVTDLFQRALPLSTEERAALLASECADAPQVRAEVEAMLAASDEDATDLRLPGADLAGLAARVADAPPPEAPSSAGAPGPGAGSEAGPGAAAGATLAAGSRVGAYEIRELVGRGGMSEVYRAVRADDQYHREVAIKLMGAGPASAELQQRFRQERQILAQLEHPNIAALLDGGVTDAGRPYLVMPLVVGEPITAWAERQGLDVPARLALLRTVCETVQFAHTNLVVHRDLKPSNILVTAAGEVRLLDFGIAKLLDPEQLEMTLATTGDLRLLTPGYAAPEQLRGEPVTTATDVHALGVLMYELLTGRRPFAATSLIALERAVCEEDPAAPSTLAHRSLPPDLDAIVLMALRKEPDRRYAAAGQLADDLGRYLRGEPVRARPDTAGYRLRKFVTRHRGAVALAALVAALLLGATGFSWQQARARSDALAVAEAERDKAQQLSRFLIDIFAEAEPTAGGEVSARELLDRGAERLRRDLRGRPLTVAAMATAMGEAYAALGAYDQADSLYHAALRLRAGRLPPGHPDLADPLRQLGLLRGAQARYAEGIALLDSAIAVLASRDDPDGRVARARLLEHQARQLVFAGRSEEAHRALDRALALRGDVLGPDHPDLANTWDVFSALAQHERRLEDALRYRRRALALWPDSLDRRHPDYLMRLEDLARSLASLERRDTAVVVLREVLAGREAVYGPDHPDVSYSLHNLGRELAAMGERQAAIPLLERALAIREEVFGPESPTVAHIVETLAILRAREGDLAAADTMFRRSLGIYEQALGETHHETLETLGNLAHLASLRGDTLARRRWQDLRDARERAPAEAGAASAGDGPAGGDGAGAP